MEPTTERITVEVDADLGAGENKRHSGRTGQVLLVRPASGDRL